MDKTKSCGVLQIQAEPLMLLELTATVLSNSKVEIICKKKNCKNHTSITQTVERIKLLDETKNQKLCNGQATSALLPLSSPPLFDGSSTFENDIDTVFRLLQLESFDVKVLHIYLSTIVKQHQDQSSNYKFLSPLLMPDWREKPVKVLNPSNNNWKFNDFQMTHMIIEPINNTVLIAPIYAFRHFYLTIFDFKSKKIDVYDSLWIHIKNELRLRHISRILKFLTVKLQVELGRNNFLGSESWSINLHKNCSQQDDNQKCGYFVAFFTENLLSGRIENSFKNVSLQALIRTRNKMLQTVLSQTELAQKIFKIISI